jgi:CRISPR/Cas system CSM-associated protein Csm3 (group 7 of RAMP superfamily)
MRMPSKLTLAVTFYSYWHCGSAGADFIEVDSKVVRDRDGLPYVPGRTVRGLLRDAMLDLEEFGVLPAATVLSMFGSSGYVTDGGEPRPATNTSAGRIAVTDLRLDESVASWLRTVSQEESAAYRATLFESVARTAIDDQTGTALDGTLRAIECAVPLRLMGEIDLMNPADAEGSLETDPWENALRRAAILVRAIGAGRTRGLGRCSMEILQ